MTAMFALFLVLWLVNQSSDVKSAIAGYFQDPLGRASEYGSSIIKGEGAQMQMARPLGPTQVLDLRIDRLQRLADQIRDKLGKVPVLDSLRQHIEITMTDEGLRIELLEDSSGVFFQSGSAVMSPRGQQLIALIGRELSADSSQLMIEGHTDARPYVGASGYSNWELSADRANSARRLLTESGVPSQHVQQIRGLAENQLRYPNAPYDPRNRRVTITVLLDKTVDGKTIPADSVRAVLQRRR
jgi:chemotaxis protein MotB